MGNITLSVPTVIINGETIKIVPNSFTYTGGEGDIKVRAASSGGNTSSSVHSQDAETQIGKAKFDVYLIDSLDARIAQWKENVGANTVQAVQGSESGESVTLSWDNMSLVNEVERDASADGVTSLEFEGDRMVF
jgi:hypothetical protein